MSKVQAMARVALMAALLCVAAQFALPVGTVPVTIQTLLVALCGVVLGPRLGMLTVFLYLLLGAVGLPVFAGGTGGLAKLASPTGGFLIGFVPMAALCGVMREKGYLVQCLCALEGLAVLEVFGVTQLKAVANLDLQAALAAGVWPFLLKDIACVFGGVFLGRLIAARLEKAR